MSEARANAAAHAHTFDVFPALHLRGGRLVDLAPGLDDGFHDGPGGDVGEGSPDAHDPLGMARHWIAQGARWLHVVNVDAAFDEDACHPWALLESLCALPVHVQYGGGLLTAGDIRRALAAGASRILLGTAAVDSPQLVYDAIVEHGRERIGLAILTDAAGDVVTRGQLARSGLGAIALARQMKQLGVTVATHMRLEPDGSMTGTDLESSRELAESSGLDVVVGGEVRDMEDVVACYNHPGITGVLIGKALQSGAIDLRTALSETRATLAFESGLPRWKAAQSTLPVRLRHALAQGFLAAHLPPARGLRVLDAGGGIGTDSLPLAADGARVDLVDRSLSMLQDFEASAEALGAGDRVTVHRRDIREIRRHFAPDSVDLVLAHGVIQYSDDWESLLGSMIAPLARGGLLSLITRNLHAAPYDIDLATCDAAELPVLLDRTRGPSNVFDTDVLLFSAAWLADHLDTLGFDVVGNHGLVCRHTLPETGDSPAGTIPFESLVALESAMGSRSPYRETARHVHLIARRR